MNMFDALMLPVFVMGRMYAAYGCNVRQLEDPLSGEQMDF